MKRQPIDLTSFSFVPSDGVPSLSLDKLARLYISTSASRLLDVQPYDTLIVAYHEGKDEFAIVKDASVVGDIEGAGLSVYVVDKRRYLHVRKLVNHHGIHVNQTAKYEYNRGASDGSVAVFRRVS